MPGATICAWGMHDISAGSATTRPITLLRQSFSNREIVFSEARKNPLSVLFFDELESIFQKNTGDTGIHETGKKVISVLLQELSGIDSDNNNPILLMGATNRPWMVDEAFLRSGRFDVKAYVGLPDYAARKKIIENSVKTVEYPVDQDAIEYLTEATEGFCGADISGLFESVRQTAFDRNLNHYTKDLFVEAREKAVPSCNAEISQKIAEWEESFGLTREKKK